MRPGIINRELSWLSFNERVLQEAEDNLNPLIERLRFLGIFSNNLDEFFRVRVASVKRMITYSDEPESKYDLKPSDLLAEIQNKVLSLQERFLSTKDQIIEELKAENIFIINEKELDEEQIAFLKKYFQETVWPALVPIMMENIPQFPELKDKSIYFAIKLSHNDKSKNAHFALLEIPSRTLPRFTVLPQRGDKKYIIYLDDIIRFFLDDIFSIFDYDLIEAYTIKITRDAQLDLDNDISESYLEKMKRSLKRRKRGQPVRFVYDRSISKSLLKFLKDAMHLDDDDNLIPGGRYHNSKDFMKFPNVGGAELVYKKIEPLSHPDIKPYNSIIRQIKEKDILLHYPYQSYTYVIDFLREAAIDPLVKSIKITLYRVAKDSKVINALINAAKNGKSVTAVLELQARFDEENNIYWSNILQEEGVNVIFGVKGLKVHSKLCLVQRKENGKIVNYSKIGTGNFHEGTAQIYSDFSLFTADNRITNEVVKVFKMIEGIYTPVYYRHLILSPTGLRNKFYRFINREIKNAKSGKEAAITIKVNSLVDIGLIEKLYSASRAGVKVKIIVRGICSVIPGVKGFSEHIEAISILDKFLEHSRLYIFANAGDPQYFLSSADWMTRNLDRRVEVTCPIYDKKLQKEIDDFIEIQSKDNVKARIIDKDQKNEYVSNKKSQIRSQYELYEYYKSKLTANKK